MLRHSVQPYSHLFVAILQGTLSNSAVSFAGAEQERNYQYFPCQFQTAVSSAATLVALVLCVIFRSFLIFKPCGL